MARSLSTGIITVEVFLWRDLSAVDSKGVVLGGGSFGLFNSAMRVLPTAV